MGNELCCGCTAKRGGKGVGDGNATPVKMIVFPQSAVTNKDPSSPKIATEETPTLGHKHRRGGGGKRSPELSASIVGSLNKFMFAEVLDSLTDNEDSSDKELAEPRRQYRGDSLDGENPQGDATTAKRAKPKGRKT